MLPYPGDDIDNDTDKGSDKMPDGCPRALPWRACSASALANNNVIMIIIVIVMISLSHRWLSTCPAPESPLLLCSRLSSAASRSPRSPPILSSSSLPSWFLKSLQTPFTCGFVGELWKNFKRTWDNFGTFETAVGQLCDIFGTTKWLLPLPSAYGQYRTLIYYFYLLPVMARYNVFQPKSAMIL